jgi:hypothetical protein
MIETIKKNNANLSILSLRCSFSPRFKAGPTPIKQPSPGKDRAQVKPRYPPPSVTRLPLEDSRLASIRRDRVGSAVRTGVLVPVCPWQHLQKFNLRPTCWRWREQ